MPPRFTFWTIILDGQPTAFRAAAREQLLPTLKQLQAKNPGAALKWFAHGRVWESPDQARQSRERKRAEAREAAREQRRGSGWRPGGSHKDPREKFKRETFQARRRREKKAARLSSEGQGFSPDAGRDKTPVPPGYPPPSGYGGPAEAQGAKADSPAPSHATKLPRLRKPR